MPCGTGLAKLGPPPKAAKVPLDPRPPTDSGPTPLSDNSAPKSTSWPFPDPTSTPSFLFPRSRFRHRNFRNKLLRSFISLSRSPKPLSLAVQENPPGLLGGGDCLIVPGNLDFGKCRRIYKSFKCGPYNNRRGMVFEVYALVNFC